MDGNKEERIRARAYELWEREGKPEGREYDHWEQARREVEGEDGQQDTAADASIGSEAGAMPVVPSGKPTAPKRRPARKTGG